MGVVLFTTTADGNLTNASPAQIMFTVEVIFEVLFM